MRIFRTTTSEGAIEHVVPDADDAFVRHAQVRAFLNEFRTEFGIAYEDDGMDKALKGLTFEDVIAETHSDQNRLSNN